MKRIITSIATMMVMALSVYAQVPQTFTYQAVLRDVDNKLITEKTIVVNLQIVQGEDDGIVVYSESHEIATNQYGLMTLYVGAGESSDDFSSIDWSQTPYFVKTIVEVNGNTITDQMPLLSVPYAFYAAKAGTAEVDLSDYAKKSDIPEPVDLSVYALKSDIPAEVDLTDYAKKSDIPEPVDLSGYALKSDVEYLNTYATKNSVSELLNNYVLKSEIPAEVDLTDYAKKTDIPAPVNLSNYLLKSQTPKASDYYTKSEIDEKLTQLRNILMNLK